MGTIFYTLSRTHELENPELTNYRNTSWNRCFLSIITEISEYKFFSKILTRSNIYIKYLSTWLDQHFI